MHTTKQFCQLLFNDEKITFRAIKEDGKAAPSIATHENLDETFVQYHNQKGYGIFYLPNSSGSKGTADNDIHTCNAVFIDVDNADLPVYIPVKPSAIVSRTDGKGHHLYWFLNATNDIETWRTAQKALINFYQSDPVIKNPARLMRLPGTVNRKIEKDGQTYEIKTLVNTRYDLSDILTGHTEKTEILKQIRRTEKSVFTDMADKGAIHGAMIKLVNRLHGLGFDDDDIFNELQHVNKVYFKNAYEEKTLRQKVTAKNYAKNKKGAELIEEIEKELARQEKVQEALKDWYYIVKGNFFININNLQIERNKEGFNAVFASIANQVNLSNYAFLHSLIKMAETIVYEPGKETIMDGGLDLPVLNIWQDDRIIPSDTPYQWFLDHLYYLMKPEEAEHFLNWLAYAVQNPGVKIRHAVLIIGGFGVGKSIMFELFKKLFGPSNAHAPQNENLSDKYTKWAKHTCFTLINELKQDGNHFFYNAIKPFITEDTIEIREMYKDPYTIRNTMNILAFSNEEVPIRLEQGDRRWFVVRSNATKKEGQYYIDFLKHCESDAGGVMKFLLDRDLSAFNPGEHPGNTEAKQYIIDQSKSDAELWLGEQIENGNGLFKNDFVCVRDIIDELPTDLKFSKYVTAKLIGRLIRKYGGEPLPSTIRVKGEVKQYFVIRNHETHKKLDNTGISKLVKDAYEEQADDAIFN